MVDWLLLASLMKGGYTKNPVDPKPGGRTDRKVIVEYSSDEVLMRSHSRQETRACRRGLRRGYI